MSLPPLMKFITPLFSVVGNFYFDMFDILSYMILFNFGDVLAFLILFKPCDILPYMILFNLYDVLEFLILFWYMIFYIF